MKKIIILCMTVCLLSQVYMISFAAPDTEERQENVQEIRFDRTGLDEDGIYRKYAEQFNGRDVVLIMDGEDLEYISCLRKFSFRSLNLILEFPDKDACANAPVYRDLLFPETVSSLTVNCGGEPSFAGTDAMAYLIVSLSLCSPQAWVNDRPVSAWISDIHKFWSEGYYNYYETTIKLYYLLNLIREEKLEVMEEKPVFVKKLLFLVLDDVDMASQECVFNQEPFYNVPSAWLADSFDSAETAVFIFPVESCVGSYANGSDAVCMYTRVCVVDLQRMKMYPVYTAVKNDPPESIDILSEEDMHSGEKVTGLYEPKKAVSQIMESGNITNRTEPVSPEECADPDILPWMKETSQQIIAFNTAALLAARRVADGGEQTEEETSQTEQEKETAKESGTEKNREEEATDKDPAEETTQEEQTDNDREETEKETTKAQTPAAGVTYGYDWLDEDTLFRIFDALGDDVYHQTFETLKTGRDVVSGTKGETALAIQNTLIALGKQIAADSSVGNATLGALNDAQRALGTETTRKINSRVYASLMPALLICLNEPAAESILKERMDTAGEGAYDYYKACVLCIGEHYYEAKKLFEESGYKDYDAQAAACVQEMPETGLVYKKPDLTGKGVNLTVQINSTDESASTAVMIYTAEDELAYCLLVRGSGEAKSVLAPGSYKIIDGTGYHWYGLRDMFGEEGVYESMIFPDGSDELAMESGFDYTITFNVAEHNENAQNIGGNTVDWSQLENRQ